MNISRTLIVEDDKDLITALSDKISLEQLQVDFAKNGYEGVRLAQEKKYKLIILDIMLPVMDGGVVLDRLRESGGKNADTPVYLLSALPTASIEQSFEKKNYQGILSKSDVGPKEIVKLIKKYTK